MSSIVVDDTLNNVEKEIVEAPKSKPTLKAAPKPDPKMPSKFAGKSASEVAEAFSHLEKELGRKNNEVGELRKLSDSFLQAEISRNEGTNQTPDTAVEEEVDFYDDPAKAVKSAIRNDPTLQELKRNQVRQQKLDNMAKLKQEFPDFDAVVKDPKFQEYAKGSVTDKGCMKQQTLMTLNPLGN